MASTTATKPSSTPRLPRSRESRPMLIGLAILLIVGGALASAWLATQAGHRAYFVAIDVSCLSPVSQAIDDKTVTPALIGSSDNTIVQTTCRD